MMTPAHIDRETIPAILAPPDGWPVSHRLMVFWVAKWKYSMFRPAAPMNTNFIGKTGWVM